MQIESTIRSWWCEAFLSVSTSHWRSMLELPLKPISLCWSDDEGWSDTDSDVLTLDKVEEVDRSTQGGLRFLGVVGHRQAPPLPSSHSPTCHHLSLPKPELKLVKIHPCCCDLVLCLILAGPLKMLRYVGCDPHPTFCNSCHLMQLIGTYSRCPNFTLLLKGLCLLEFELITHSDSAV